MTAAPHATGAALHWTLAILVVAAVGLAAHCLLISRRERSVVALLALAGGVIALPIEPMWDVVVKFTFAGNSHPIAFTAYGRDIPLYLAFIYPAFIGWGSVVGYLLIRSGAARRTLLAIPVAFFAADMLIEIAGQQANLWTYYGTYAPRIFDWPIVFGVLNGMIPLLGGALLSVLAKLLHGWSRVLMAFVVPTVYAAIYAAAGWPAWAVTNANVPRGIAWVAGFTTIGLCVAIARLVASAVGSPDPVREASPVAAAAPA